MRNLIVLHTILQVLPEEVCHSTLLVRGNGNTTLLALEQGGTTEIVISFSLSEVFLSCKSHPKSKTSQT